MHDNSRQDTLETFGRLIDLVIRLRAPDGCPWDRRQTPQTFKTYLIEEAHELAEAIDKNDAVEVCEELGDLLFQILFIGNLYVEANQFRLTDCLEAIIAKMIRRHPHVFGESRIDTEEELKRQWQSIKKNEEKKANPLDGVPRSLPALRRAHRVLDRAGRETQDDAIAITARLQGVHSAMDDILSHCGSGTREETLDDQVGALLFDLVRLSRQAGVNAEDALQKAIDRFVADMRRMVAPDFETPI